MQHKVERIGELTNVEPPASLDVWVRQRMQRVLRAHSAPVVEGQAPREALVPVTPPIQVKGRSPAAQAPAIALPLLERCVYAVGLMAYGAHALGAAARLLWRAVAG